MGGLIARRAALAAGALVVACFALASALPGLPHAVRLLGIDVAWTLAAALAAATLLAASRAERAFRRPLLFLGLGAASWGIGQALWTYYELSTGIAPYLSLADLGYAGSLPLFAAALVTWPRRRQRVEPGELVDGLVVLGVGAIASWEFVVGPLGAHGVDGFADAVNLAYPIGDALVLGILLAGLTLDVWAARGRLLLVAGGLGSLVVADTLYALAGEAYETGSPYDVGWIAAFTALAAVPFVRRTHGDQLRLPAGGVAIGLLVALAALRGYQIAEQVPYLPPLELVDVTLAAAVFLTVAARFLWLARTHGRESARLRSLQAELEAETALGRATAEASRTGVCVTGVGGEVRFTNGTWRRLHAELADPGAAEVEVGVVGRRLETASGRILAVSAARLPGGEVVRSLDDVTDAERERATRDRFLAEIVRAQDLEARRIAELLHDDAVQRLTALGLRLELAALRSGGKDLAVLGREAGAITAGIRQLLAELHPVVLESQGLAAAVETAAATLRSQGLIVKVDPLESRFGPDLEHLAYRLVQEAFSNVVKHAGASRVVVSLSVEDGRLLRCAVDDDGAGFDPAAAESARGTGSLGLNLVRERLELAGGRFEIESAPGAGTRFAFELPLPVAATEPARELVA